MALGTWSFVVSGVGVHRQRRQRGLPARCAAAPTFRELYQARLPEWLFERLELLGFASPTSVQRQVLDVVLDDAERDLVIHSKTGSGKTLAYLIPLLASVEPARASLQAAVVVPTQELGMQVYKVARRVASGWHGADNAEKQLVVMPLLDQANLRRQKLQLRESAPRVVIGTVPRLLELEASGRLDLTIAQVLVVDEFDACMADKDTSAQLRSILQSRCSGQDGRMPVKRTTILASATVPQHRQFIRTCVREKWTRPSVSHVWIDSDERVPESIVHKFVVCDPSKKLLALAKVLQMEQPASAIVFFQGSRDIAAIARQLETVLKLDDGALSTLAADSPLAERKRAMRSFRDGDSRLLIATDVAARGLDIPEVTHVFNVDLPSDADVYLHRAGRTGRQGRSGIMCSLSGPNEVFVLDRIENALGISLERVT